MIDILRQRRNARIESFASMWPAVARTIQQQDPGEDADRYHSVYLRACKSATHAANPVHTVIPIFSTILALYPGFTVLVATFASISPTSLSSMAAYLLAYIVIALLFIGQAWAHSVIAAIRTWLFLGFITLLAMGSVLAIFALMPSTDKPIPPATDDAFLNPDFRLHLVLGGTAIFVSVFTSLLSLAVVRFLLSRVIRFVLPDHLLTRRCIHLARRISLDEDFAQDTFDKRAFVRSLHEIANDFQTTFLDSIGPLGADSQVVRMRLNGAARQFDTMADWVILAQRDTRAAVLNKLFATIAALVTGRLHHLPYDETPSKAGSGEVQEHRPAWLQVLSLAPALCLLTLGLAGVLLPAELRQWATSFGAVWLLLGASSILTGGSTSIIGTVRDVLSSASSAK